MLVQEDHFSVYEPYCANLTAAQDLAIAENASLSVSTMPLLVLWMYADKEFMQKLANVLDPVSELAPLLIKPVQRLCKYPLLLAVSQVSLSCRAQLSRGMALS